MEVIQQKPYPEIWPRLEAAGVTKLENGEVLLTQSEGRIGFGVKLGVFAWFTVVTMSVAAARLQVDRPTVRIMLGRGELEGIQINTGPYLIFADTFPQKTKTQVLICDENGKYLDLLKPIDVAGMLGVSADYVRRLCRLGKLEFMKFGPRSIRISRHEVIRYVESSSGVKIKLNAL